MKSFNSFFYFLIIFAVFHALFSKKVVAENKYYHYEIDEQIRISEDEDYIHYFRNLEKAKALKDQARKKHKSMRKQQQLAHEKTRKEQIKRRHRLSLNQKVQEKLEMKYEEEVKRKDKQQEKLQIQHAKQKYRERQSLIREQASTEDKFYNNQPLLK